ncbi:unnamed protein product [Alopecurus aequalis]
MLSAKKRARRHSRRPWSELPQDLLDVIVGQLAPAFGDRVRFRGVCQAWCAAELAHPRPPMPWLVVPGHYVSLHDASIHRVPLPEDATAALCLGSFGHWLALLPSTSSELDRPFLLNAFTMERIELPQRTTQPMVKFVMSSAPDSKSCTVAAIVDDENHMDYNTRSRIVVCHVGQEDSWRAITRVFDLHDIIFFEGKLHALDARARVHVFQDGDLQRGDPWMPPEQIERHFYLGNAKLHLVVLHARLHMVGRALGNKRVPGCTQFTSALEVFELGDTEKRPERVKDLGGHAVFVGDSCCNAFPVSSRGGKIRENQICFVDDEKNYLSSLVARGKGLFRLLLSYDVGNGCLRTYEPHESLSGTWRCVMAQRFPHARAMGSPPREALSEEELRLRDMANSLGATVRPTYTTNGSGVTVQIHVPKTASLLVKNHAWSFTQSRPSTREARQAAAYEAATFLRSRFRSVFDDSPWSSVPRYHRHVDEDDEEDEAEDAIWQTRCLFRHRQWYRG